MNSNKCKTCGHVADTVLQNKKWTHFTDTIGRKYEIDWTNPSNPILISNDSFFWNTSKINENGELCFIRDLWQGFVEKAELYVASNGKHKLCFSQNSKYGFFDDWDICTEYEISLITDPTDGHQSDQIN